MARDETIKLSLIDGVTKNLSEIRAGVSGVGASLAKLNQAADLASKGFSAIGAAASAVGDAVQGAADLESALVRVADITRATAEEQVALQQAVQNAVSTVGVGADQAAQALLLMAEDGFSASEAIGALNTVLAFAKANAQDAATATQALGGVLDTFGEKPQIIGQLADQLTAASRAAGVGTATLQQGLAAVGVQAEQAGLGVSDAVAALAALASRGIEGTQAAKQLGTVLTELNNPASKAGEALTDAGLSGKSFGDIVAALSADSSRAAPILEALGNRPRAALRVLLSDGGGALREFTDIVNEAGGATEAAAAKIDETFNGALARFQAAIANLRNDFLTPILQPLADEMQALSEKINAFAGSPQFVALRNQFEKFATGAIRAIGDLIEKVDFEQVAGSIASFSARAKTAFDSLVVVVNAAAAAIRATADAVDWLAERAEAFDRAMGFYEGGVKRLNVAAQEGEQRARKWGDRLEEAGNKGKKAGAGAREAAKGADEFSTAADAAGDAAAAAADGLGEIPPAATLIVGSLKDAAGAADTSALSLDALQKKLAEVREALSKAAPGTPEFAQLAQQAAALEQQIAATKAQIDEASGATDRLGQSAGNTAGSLRDFAAAAGQAGDAAERADDSAGQVSDQFGNIGQQAAAAAADLGNMSQSLIDNALALQAQARSGQEIIDIWEGVTRQYNEANSRIEQAIALIERQNAATDEEAQIRRRLQLQYGTESTLIEKLVQLKLRENNERERSIALSKEETAEIERRNAAQAGALGFGGPATPSAQPSATGGRGSSGGGGRSGEPAQIVVNVQGAPTDAAGWRDIVSRFVIPEIERVQRLSR